MAPTHYAIQSRTSELRLLPIPPPYRAWLTISNDPDLTKLDAWRELHSVIWEELQLPFADTFFVTSYNESFPDQVNLRDHPEIVAAHPHDTMHTWGDFLQNRSHRFSRDDAVDALRMLRQMDLQPRVWTDHSNFTGNLIHRARVRVQPELVDSSGHTYENFEYTADLIWKAGVRFIWDGEVTRHVGQDRRLTRREWYSARSSGAWKGMLWSWADMIGRPLWGRLRAGAFDYQADGNRQYFSRRLDDSQVFYAFRRFGSWRDADIDGLAARLCARTLDRLVEVGGTCVLYTHLGKKHASRRDSRDHIPPPTRHALEDLAARHRSGNIMISGTARLLEYLTLRDHAVVGDGIDFRADGIRFESLAPSDLAGHTFGVITRNPDFQIFCEGLPVRCERTRIADRTYRLSFDKSTAPSASTT